jgi:hypothetical protein
MCEIDAGFDRVFRGVGRDAGRGHQGLYTAIDLERRGTVVEILVVPGCLERFILRNGDVAVSACSIRRIAEGVGRVGKRIGGAGRRIGSTVRRCWWQISLGHELT